MHATAGCLYWIRAVTLCVPSTWWTEACILETPSDEMFVHVVLGSPRAIIALTMAS